MRPADCFAYAQRGPLFSQLEPDVTAAEEWARHGSQLAAELCGAGTAVDSPEQLEAANAGRIFHLYLPIYFWCRALVRARRAADPHRAVGIGLSAPQGCGKTTLVKTLVGRFAADGLYCATASIDDFYLPRAQQQALADANTDNRLLQVRGNAGTHDLDLGVDTLSALLDRRANVPIPQYDKSAFNGRGDRAPREEWHVQSKPPDVVLFEGWMNGFSAVDTDDSEEQGVRLDGIDFGLRAINAKLGGYARWHELMSAWVVMGVDDTGHVGVWRLEAERAMRDAGRPGMSDEQVADFVSRYIPAYQAYLPAMYAAAAGDGVGGSPTMLVMVDKNRAVVPPEQGGV